MFKAGDKIICLYIGDTSLKKYQTYIISDVFINPKGNKITHVKLVGKRDSEYYKINRFIKTSEYRKLKLQKICSKKEIK